VSICVLGIFVADLVFVADSIPVKGQTVVGNRRFVGPGGKGSNQAIAAARAGGNVSFLTKLGEDDYSKMAIDLYKQAKINYQGIVIDKNTLTGAAAILVNEKTGENAINVVTGAAGGIDIGYIENSIDIIKQSKIFLAQLESPKDATFEALKKAKEFGCTTILNPAPASDIPDEYFSLIDFFTPNEKEAEYFINKPIENEKDCLDAARSLLLKGVKNVIITLGDKGCYFKNNEEEFLVPATKLNKKVKDTTGAGDAFNGALCVGLSQNKNYKQSIEFANLVAGISVTRDGAANSMPYLNEIEEILNGI